MKPVLCLTLLILYMLLGAWNISDAIMGERTMNAITDQLKQEVLSAYGFHGTLLSAEPHGNGHINDTFLLVFDIYGMGRLKVILQRINTDVFPKPQELMENISGVTSYRCSLL